MPESDLPTATRMEIQAATAAQLDCVCGPDPTTISAEMGRSFGVLGEFIGRHQLRPIAPPRAIYTAYGPEGVKITLAMPIAPPAAEPPAGGPVRIAPLPAAKTMRFTHHGPYSELMGTYGRITEYLKREGLIESEADWGKYMPMWEEYINDPETTPEAELVTHIHLPVE